MVSFRKMSLAFAGCLLMGVSANAQFVGDCTAALASTNLRAEALTQPIPDFEISCTVTGGQAAVVGNTATIQLTSDGFKFTGLKDADDNIVNASLTVDGTATATKAVLSANGQSVSWTEVNLDKLNALQAAGPNVVRKIVISGLKMNASALATFSTPKIRVGLVNYGDATRKVIIDPTTLTQEIGTVQSAINFSFKNKHTVDCAGASAPATADLADPASLKLMSYISFNAGYPGALVIDDQLTAQFKVPAGAKLYVSSSAIDVDGNFLSAVNKPSVTYGTVAAEKFVEVKADSDGIYQATWTISGTTGGKDKYLIPLYLTVPANSNAADTLTAIGSLGLWSDVAVATDDTDVPEPRFITPTEYTDPIYEISSCKTTLLFPYATNVGNWDTGIAISNITADMKDADDKWASGKTTAKTGQSGTCTLYFVGDNAPAKAIKTESVAAGKTLAFMVGSKAEGFNGYLKVQCDFSSGKGFAFMSSSDLGGVGVGYVAQEGIALIQ